MKILKKRARKFMEGAMDFGAKMVSPPHSFFFFLLVFLFLFLFLFFFFFFFFFFALLPNFARPLFRFFSAPTDNMELALPLNVIYFFKPFYS